MESTAKVTVVYCAEDQQFLLPIDWYEGLTASQALDDSKLASLTALPDDLHMGVFSLKIDEPATYLLQAGERLEVYRPLKMNPKDVRRLRAKRNPVGRYMRGNQWKRQQKSTD